MGIWHSYHVVVRQSLGFSYSLGAHGPLTDAPGSGIESMVILPK